jgi:hypothetical protein
MRRYLVFVALAGCALPQTVSAQPNERTIQREIRQDKNMNRIERIDDNRQTQQNKKVVTPSGTVVIQDAPTARHKVAPR